MDEALAGVIGFPGEEEEATVPDSAALMWKANFFGLSTTEYDTDLVLSSLFRTSPTLQGIIR